MDCSLPQQFSLLCVELSNLLYVKDYNKTRVNALIDELNSKPYNGELFVTEHDASILITALSVNIKAVDEFVAAKASHLMNSIIIKQKTQLSSNYLSKVVSWHVECLKNCSDIILLDILHNMQCILQLYPQASEKFAEELIGSQGILLKFLDLNKQSLATKNSLQSCLLALKCIVSLVLTADEAKKPEEIEPSVKKNVSKLVVDLLMKGSTISHDEFLFCKVVISALRVLTQLYFNDPNGEIALPEVLGICQYFTLYGIVNMGPKPQRIMPAQQTIAAKPVVQNTKGGKKQKLRKHRNNAIVTLKKEIPVTDRSLMKDVDKFENNSAYKPASYNFIEPQRAKNWALTSDSDMSDVETGEAKLIALRSRVRQSGSYLLLVLVKVRERKEMFGYWWALLPDCPEPTKWLTDDSAKNTLAYAAVIDPIASSRASVLSVILAMLSGSRMYLSQAETSKKKIVSFIPFSISLGYVITCMHRILTGILESERSHVVIIVTLKCCAALVQATPYHRLKEGLITELVKATRKFLVHRDSTLQVGALITMGCVLSIDIKKDEVLSSIKKVTVPLNLKTSQASTVKADSDCEDFEEGYSDDEMFTAVKQSDIDKVSKECHYFRSWILDICFKNMGWVFRGTEVNRCKPSVIPVILESLQVLSAIAFHHLPDLLHSHISLLGDILCEMLQHEHQDVVLQAARTVSMIGDGLQKLQKTDQSPPLAHCVNMWEKLITPLSSVLQCHDNVPAKAVVCDCIANIGERAFKELPKRTQVLCCTLLVGSTSDLEPAVRAAAVRALAMTVMFKTLREDIGFVSDCGENILRALNEQSLVVRTKAAWALGNLSDALVLNVDDPAGDDIDDYLLHRLLEASIKCIKDHDKIKMSATRSIGNLLRLIWNEKLVSMPELKTSCEIAIGKLLLCACKVTNMKVRWNACYALGNAMKNAHLFTSISGWQGHVFFNLSQLAQECKNIKVRITAGVALRSPTLRRQYGIHFSMVWRGVLTAMENAAYIDDFTEFKHKDNLTEQLCVTLSHLCCVLQASDLNDLLDALVFHHECAKRVLGEVCNRLPPENASSMMILEAAKYVTVDVVTTSDLQMQALAILQDVFIWDM